MNAPVKYFSIIFLIFTFVSLVYSQHITENKDHVPDSLLYLLSSATDTTRIDLLNELSKYIEHSDPENSFKHAVEAVSLSDSLGYSFGLAFGYKNIGNYYTEKSDFQKALEFYQKSLDLVRSIGDREEEIKVVNNIGNVHRFIGNYDDALEHFLVALKMSEESDDIKGVAYALNNIGIIYAIQGQYDKVLDYFLRTLEITEELGDKKGIAYSLNNIGLVYEELEEYDKALEYHFRSLKIKEETGNKTGIASSFSNIGNIYRFLGDKDNAIRYHSQSLVIERELENTFGMASTMRDMGEVYLEDENYNLALSHFEEALKLSKEINAKELIQDCYEQLSKVHKEKKNYRLSLEYYELYTAQKDSIFNETTSRQIAELQTRYETEKKEAEIKLLKNEKTISDLELSQLQEFRIYLTLVLTLVVLIAVILYRAYRLKRKANLYLEERNRLDMEDRARVLNMFGQQVSQEIVDELLTESSETKSKRKFVCIMFLDIRDFTPKMEGRQPEEIIAYQNDVFGFMIEIINKNFGIINQFLGDGYMATFGAPLSTGYDCDNALKSALEIIETANKKSAEGTIPETRIGIGLHAGDVVTGNVGTSIRKQYSITGNTVILASRIEKLNKKYNSQLLVSEEVLQNCKIDYNTENLGEVQIKGREKPINVFKLA